MLKRDYSKKEEPLPFLDYSPVPYKSLLDLKKMGKEEKKNEKYFKICFFLAFLAFNYGMYIKSF